MPMATDAISLNGPEHVDVILLINGKLLLHGGHFYDTKGVINTNELH